MANLVGIDTFNTLLSSYHPTVSVPCAITVYYGCSSTHQVRCALIAPGDYREFQTLVEYGLQLHHCNRSFCIYTEHREAITGLNYKQHVKFGSVLHVQFNNLNCFCQLPKQQWTELERNIIIQMYQTRPTQQHHQNTASNSQMEYIQQLQVALTQSKAIIIDLHDQLTTSKKRKTNTIEMSSDEEADSDDPYQVVEVLPAKLQPAPVRTHEIVVQKTDQVLKAIIQLPEGWPKEIANLHYCTCLLWSEEYREDEYKLGEHYPPMKTVTTGKGKTMMTHTYSLLTIKEINLTVKGHLIKYGLFAKQDITMGEDVHFLEYAGIVRVTTAKSGILKQHQYNKSRYVVDLGTRAIPNSTDVKLYEIDAQVYGNEARFINHFKGLATEPNVEMFPYFSKNDGKLHVYIDALRNIEAGEQILLDYGPEYWSNV